MAYWINTISISRILEWKRQLVTVWVEFLQSEGHSWGIPSTCWDAGVDKWINVGVLPVTRRVWMACTLERTLCCTLNPGLDSYQYCMCISTWIKKVQLQCHEQTSRCCTRGKSEESILALKLGKHHLMSRAGASAAPQKRKISSKNLKKLLQKTTASLFLIIPG